MENKRIWLSLAKMSGFELEFVQKAFDTNWVVPLGPNVDGFEEDLMDYLHRDCHVVALSSGTAALHLALIQLGVKPDSEVICQSFTFAASANPIAYLGAKPVFIDSEPDTWNMDPALLESAIRERLKQTGKYPKAIIIVHLYGMPANMKEILSVASTYAIPVVEDAAEALGSVYNGQNCGTFGKFGILSFNGNKIITTSGGGALICNTIEEASKTKFYATQARDHAPHYQHSEIGYNYRMSNICAGIGRGQMTFLDQFVARRREIHTYYCDKLSSLPGISVLKNPSPEFNSNYWLTCIQINAQEAGYTREDLRLAMETANIETRPLWKPMHLQPVYQDASYYGSGVAEELFKNGLCLPSGATLTAEDLTRVIEVFHQIHL